MKEKQNKKRWYGLHDNVFIEFRKLTNLEFEIEQEKANEATDGNYSWSPMPEAIAIKLGAISNLLNGPISIKAG